MFSTQRHRLVTNRLTMRTCFLLNPGSGPWPIGWLAFLLGLLVGCNDFVKKKSCSRPDTVKSGLLLSHGLNRPSMKASALSSPKGQQIPFGMGLGTKCS
jgi:hypothetical protein